MRSVAKRRLALTGVALASLLLSGIASAEPTKTAPAKTESPIVRLTLKDAITRLDTGPAGAMARAEIDRYEALRQRANWAVLHNLKVTTAFGFMPTCDVRIEDGEPTGYCREEIDQWDYSIYRPTFDVRAEGTVLLYTFGKLRSAREQAEAGVRAVTHAARSERAKLVRTIKRAYWGMLLGRELSDLVTDARQRLEKEDRRRADRVRELRGSWEDEDEEEEEEEVSADGTDPLQDARLDRARVAGYLAEARILEAKAAAGLRMASEGLRIAVGLPPQQRVAPEDPKDLVALLDELPPQAELLETTLRTNPTLKAAEAAYDAAVAELGRAEANLWPSFVAQGGMRGAFTASSADCIVDPAQPTVCRDPQTFYPYALLAMQWDLDYPELVTRHSEAKAKLDKARAQRDGARLLLEQGLDQAYNGVREKLTVLAARRDAERWARKRRTTWAARCGGLELVDEGGSSGSSCDEGKLTSALRTYLEAKAARLQATYDLNMAVAALSEAVGKGVGADLLLPAAKDE